MRGNDRENSVRLGRDRASTHQQIFIFFFFVTFFLFKNIFFLYIKNANTICSYFLFLSYILQFFSNDHIFFLHFTFPIIFNNWLLHNYFPFYITSHTIFFFFFLISIFRVFFHSLCILHFFTTLTNLYAL